MSDIDPKDYTHPKSQRIGQNGITKREHYAALFMQALLSNPNCTGSGFIRTDLLVPVALEAADNLLEALKE